MRWGHVGMNMPPALAKPPVCWGDWLVEIRWGDTGSSLSSATSWLCDPGHIPGPQFPHLSNRLLGRPVGMPRPTLMEDFDSSLHVFIRVFPGVQPAWGSQLPLCAHTDPLAWPCALASVWSSPLHLGLFPFRICWSPSVGSQMGLPRNDLAHSEE